MANERYALSYFKFTRYEPNVEKFCVMRLWHNHI